MVRGTPLSVNAQSGALFGLDARIAMAVFAVLTLVAGASIMVNMDSSRAKSLSSELADMGRAVEAIQSDTRVDIMDALEEPNDKNAFTALYDNMVLRQSDNVRGRWLGPYVNFTSNIHPHYGDMLIQKHPAKHTEDCTNPDELCYYWVVYSNVKMNIVSEINEIMDGKTESAPNLEGRLQWTPDRDTGIVYYRASKALAGE